jgi:hypothetical protein
MKRFLIAALSIAASSGTVLAEDLEAGEASFRKCARVIASARTLPTRLDRS